MMLPPGTMLGQYRVEDFVGEGGFAFVYKGCQPALDRTVALKVLKDNLACDMRFVTRFRREAEAAFSLKHPNIVQVYDFQGVDGKYFIVMDYVDGPSLRDMLFEQGAFNHEDDGEEDVTQSHNQVAEDDTRPRLKGYASATQPHKANKDLNGLEHLTEYYRPLAIGIVAEVGVQLCAALAYAHSFGVIHRDLKPDNVLLTRNGRALLSDFGIAHVQEETHLTRTGLRIGSLAYMSPEQITGRQDLDHRSDIYAFGILLYELLTGSVPFVGTDAVVMQKHLNEAPRPPTTLRSEIPNALEQVVLHCLKKAPAERYASATDVLQAIQIAIPATPLTALFGGSASVMPPTPEPHPGPVRAIGVCPLCGYTFELADQCNACPACENMLTHTVAKAEQARLESEAVNFIKSFNLSPGLSLEVRNYEYERTIGPKLVECYISALAHWKQALVHGSIIAPSADAQQCPDGPDLLGAIQKLYAVAALWESAPVRDYDVKLDARQEHRQLCREARARAAQLLGLYHSLRGAHATETAQMQAGYQRAREWYRRAEQTLRDTNRDLTGSIQFSWQLAGMILDFPNPASRARFPAVTLLKALIPGTAADLTTFKDYQGAWERANARIASSKINSGRALTNLKNLLAQYRQQNQALDDEALAAEQHYWASGATAKHQYQAELNGIDQRRGQNFQTVQVQLAAHFQEGERLLAEADGEARTLAARLLHTQPWEALAATDRLKAELQALQTEIETVCQRVVDQPMSRTVQLTGGWKIPQKDRLGGYKDNIELNAHIEVKPIHILHNDAIKLSQDFFKQRDYQIARSARSGLQLKRGSGLGKAFGFGIKDFPTEISVEFAFASPDVLVITLEGKVAVAGAMASSPNYLTEELDDYTRLYG